MTVSRVFPTLREAIHSTATNGTLSMKHLAAELDYSPSELSMRTTLGGDSARPFPADDEHLVKLMRVTADYSVLYTLADLCGYELRMKEIRVDELIAEAKGQVKEAMRKFQLVFDLDDERKGKGRGR